MDTRLHWIAFNVLVLIAVALDLGVFHRKAHKIEVREALIWSFAWIWLAVAFGLGILHIYVRQPSLEFFNAYLI
jgi:tellurite resistance protein TerC